MGEIGYIYLTAIDELLSSANPRDQVASLLKLPYNLDAQYNCSSPLGKLNNVDLLTQTNFGSIHQLR